MSLAFLVCVRCSSGKMCHARPFGLSIRALQVSIGQSVKAQRIKPSVLEDGLSVRVHTGAQASPYTNGNKYRLRDYESS
ncbi:predicted protein [Plenodomus lingam JN3]|uniref:Predicted protein n=1 Tax=Leptosphaeria maculans (strain JN3 / isolate v23.1.3 / race Av1-4-5-6-7-8) TaxID=985895 RepID=E4ZNB1_LEPMJ|nr:predicted protein [Plenodomus lingam JN3]CBX92970.1 predicted protein [Plenodomus lingam JN3]